MREGERERVALMMPLLYDGRQERSEGRQENEIRSDSLQYLGGPQGCNALDRKGTLAVDDHSIEMMILTLTCLIHRPE